MFEKKNKQNESAHFIRFEIKYVNQIPFQLSSKQIQPLNG